MTHVNDFQFSFYQPTPRKHISFSDEKNRSKLITFLDRVGSYSNYDKDMALRVFVDDEGDFCAFEAVKYQLAFVSTNHKLVDVVSSWNVLEPVTISELRSMIASS